MADPSTLQLDRPVGTPAARTPLAHIGLWELAMRIAHDWETSRGTHVHKGSSYYSAGIRDIAVGDLERGFLYMHQAAFEDTYPDRDRLPESPAGRFLSLDARRADQTYYETVAEIVRAVVALGQVGGSSLGLD